MVDDEPGAHLPPQHFNAPVEGSTGGNNALAQLPTSIPAGSGRQVPYKAVPNPMVRCVVLQPCCSAWHQSPPESGAGGWNRLLQSGREGNHPAAGT
jgi:hypothetical protein